MFTGVVLLFHVVQGVEFCKAFENSASTVTTCCNKTHKCMTSVNLVLTSF